MKILTTISYYTPYISGLTICAQRLIRGLTNDNFKFTVLTSRYQKNFARMELLDKARVVRISTPFILGKVPIMPGYFFQLIKEVPKADAVWIHLPQAEGLMTAVVAKLFGKKVVATVHCLPLLPSGWQRLLFQNIFDLINNLVIWIADSVVYYTKDYAENTSALWHFSEKSGYILPPIPEVRSKEYGVRNGKENKEIIIGFAGRIAEDKGFEYLIKAMEILVKKGQKIKLLVAGPRDAVGEKSYVKKIDNLVSSARLDIKFMRAIHPDKMTDFYLQIDCLVLPSINRTEAFGMVQVEAMKCGVPVIASDLPGVRIPVRLTHNGEIVPPGDPEALARTIGNTAGRIVREETDLVKKTFSYAYSIQSYRKIFTDP